MNTTDQETADKKSAETKVAEATPKTDIGAPKTEAAEESKAKKV